MAVYNSQTDSYIPDSQIPFLPGLWPPKIERRFMSRIRYLINYRIVPGFGIFCGICLAAIIILMEMDESKYGGVAGVLFGLIALSGIVILATVPKTRNWEIAEELKRYDLTQSHPVPEDGYTMEQDGVKIEFTGEGLRVDGVFYWYNRLSPMLATSNRFLRIWLALQFSTDSTHAFFIPLSSEVIAAINQFSIPIGNRQQFDFLLENKEEAFRQIYSTGSIRVPE